MTIAREVIFRDSDGQVRALSKVLLLFLGWWMVMIELVYVGVSACRLVILKLIEDTE